MRYGFVVAVFLCAGFCFAFAGAPQEKSEPHPRSTQLLMRDKIDNAQRVLEGITTADGAMVADAAKTLGMIGRAASWHLKFEKSPEYDDYRREFEKITKELEEYGAQKNFDAATLGYVRMTLTCVACHKHIRDIDSKDGD